MTKAAAVLFALAGCTSLDEGVNVDVVSATISPQPSAPDSLAAVDIVVRMVAGSRADHQLALERVTIEQPTASFSTDLALSPFAPFWIQSGESKHVSLENTGTTNAALASLCGETANLFVYIDYVDAMAGNKTEGTWAVTSVPVTCL